PTYQGDNRLRRIRINQCLAGILQHLQQRFRLARQLHFPIDKTPKYVARMAVKLKDLNGRCDVHAHEYNKAQVSRRPECYNLNICKSGPENRTFSGIIPTYFQNNCLEFPELLHLLFELISRARGRELCGAQPLLECWLLALVQSAHLQSGHSPGETNK